MSATFLEFEGNLSCLSMDSRIAKQIKQYVFQCFGIGADIHARYVQCGNDIRAETFLRLVHDAFAQSLNVHVLHFVTFFTGTFKFHVCLDMLHQIFQGLYMLLYITTFYGIERRSNLFADVVDKFALLFVVVVGNAEALLQFFDLADILQHDTDEEQQSTCQGCCQDAEEDDAPLLCADCVFLFSQEIL